MWPALFPLRTIELHVQLVHFDFFICWKRIHKRGNKMLHVFNLRLHMWIFKHFHIWMTIYIFICVTAFFFPQVETKYSNKNITVCCRQEEIFKLPLQIHLKTPVQLITSGSNRSLKCLCCKSFTTGSQRSENWADVILTSKLAELSLLSVLKRSSCGYNLLIMLKPQVSLDPVALHSHRIVQTLPLWDVVDCQWKI